MTYGEVTARMREQLIWLLERRRIQQRLGGPGSFRSPVTTTEEQRALLGGEIMRYRDTTLTYCLQAIRAAAPRSKGMLRESNLDPVDRLRDLLARHTLAPAPPGPPRPALSELLAVSPAFELVGGWQKLARGRRRGRAGGGGPARASAHPRPGPDDAEGHRRCRPRGGAARRPSPADPGLAGPAASRRLAMAAEAVSTRAADRIAGRADASVDGIGWRPTPGRIEGPALPGLAGVLQAQHNVVLDLATVPTATNLRRILITQAQLSRDEARLAASLAPELVVRFADRATLYRELAVGARTVGGELGDGRVAALESGNAAARIAAGPTPGEPAAESLQRLASLDDRIDARIHAAVEHGFHERLYFTAVNLDHLGQTGRAGIQPAARGWAPDDPSARCALHDLVHRRLRPVPPTLPMRDAEASAERVALRSTLGLEAGKSRGRPAW